MEQKFKNIDLVNSLKANSDLKNDILDTFLKENVHVMGKLASMLKYKSICDFEDALSIVKFNALKNFLSSNAALLFEHNIFWTAVLNDSKKDFHEQYRCDEGSYSSLKQKQQASNSYVARPETSSMNEDCEEAPEAKASILASLKMTESAEDFVLRNEFRKAILDIIFSLNEVQRATLFNPLPTLYDKLSPRTCSRLRAKARNEIRQMMWEQGYNYEDFYQI